MNDEPEMEYGFYPEPVEEAGVGYDDLYLAAVSTEQNFIVCVDIPDYEAIYHCAVGVKAESPLHSGDPVVRMRAMVNTMRLVGKRVEQAVAEE
jgi:hypothetical protein